MASVTDRAAHAASGPPAPLQSKDHRDLLDVIDRLRSQGLSRFVDLPQIIVCGDQSSGKSSALEAISGMSFPAKDNLCTRFATELILRRSPTSGIDISITTGSERSEAEKANLRAFTYAGTVDDLDLGQVVERAKDAMGLNGNHKVFSTDVLRIEISGPTQPHLTMVDLPGLFLAGNKDQSDEDAVLVEELVLSYMKNPRTIILAVVSAKSDFALQQVTKHARALDPKGTRTLGLITKPDMLDEGSDSERFFVELAQNKDVYFRLGWHVLRNRPYAERDTSTAARDAAEAEFFSTRAIWKALKPSQLGVAALRVRLSHVLHDHILRQLPNVLEDVTAGQEDCRATLARLGAARATIAEQRRYLLKVSARTADLTRAAVDGIYTDSFFRGSYEKRLRAVMQNTLTEFAREMRERGHARKIIDDPASGDSPPEPVAEPRDESSTDTPPSVPRSKYVQEVKALMNESRGRELPGTYNPLIVAELFSKQCKPWQGLVDALLERVFGSAFKVIEAVLRHVADGETAEALLRGVVDPSMDNIKKQLHGKADEILEPHIAGHPITYNHYLTENVQKAQAQRRRRAMEQVMKPFIGAESGWNLKEKRFFNPEALLDALATQTEPDMDTYACSMATDMMEAYYKVALKTLVDDVCILAIERCLLQKLPSILSTEIVCDLTDDEVQRIAGESSESAAERAQATEKLAVLENGMTELKRLRKHSAPMAADKMDVD